MVEPRLIIDPIAPHDPEHTPSASSRPHGYVEVQRATKDFDSWLQLFGDAKREAETLGGRPMVLYEKRRETITGGPNAISPLPPAGETPHITPPHVMIYLGFVPENPVNKAEVLNPRNLNDAEQPVLNEGVAEDMDFPETRF